MNCEDFLDYLDEIIDEIEFLEGDDDFLKKRLQEIGRKITNHIEKEILR